MTPAMTEFQKTAIFGSLPIRSVAIESGLDKNHAKLSESKHMIEKNQKPWLSRKFPWLAERETLIAEKRERNARGEFELTELGHIKRAHRAPVDEVLKFAKVARNQPEIWETIRGIVERCRRDPQTEITNDEIHFFGFFREWYLMKHDLAYSASPFRPVVGLLLGIAHGRIPDDLDSPEAREFLLQRSSIVEESDLRGEKE